MLTNEEIQEIIEDEIIVDCYDAYEAEVGWEVFMGDNIVYPFEAEYEVKKASGKTEKAKVKVIGSEPDGSNFSMKAFYVEIEWNEMLIPVDIEKLNVLEADEMTLRTLEVWKHRNRH